jgi:hypothetical protein
LDWTAGGEPVKSSRTGDRLGGLAIVSGVVFFVKESV